MLRWDKMPSAEIQGTDTKKKKNSCITLDVFYPIEYMP